MKPVIVEWLFDIYDVFDENQSKEISTDFRIVEPVVTYIKYIKYNNLTRYSHHIMKYLVDDRIRRTVVYSMMTPTYTFFSLQS